MRKVVGKIFKFIHFKFLLFGRGRFSFYGVLSASLHHTTSCMAYLVLQKNENTKIWYLKFFCTLIPLKTSAANKVTALRNAPGIYIVDLDCWRIPTACGACMRYPRWLGTGGQKTYRLYYKNEVCCSSCFCIVSNLIRSSFMGKRNIQGRFWAYIWVNWIKRHEIIHG